MIPRSLPLLMLALALGLPVRTAAAGDVLRVIYPKPESQLDAREGYPLALLRLALEHSGVPYVLEPGQWEMQQARALRQLATGQGPDIVWTVMSRERAARLRAIPIPIDRGLIGWRVLLIRRAETDRFEAIDSLADLAAFTGGQGHDWPDLALLRENGLKVRGSPTYEGLFVMLERHRIDYFPRSIAEVEAERARHGDAVIALDTHLLLHYRSGLYFFVNPDNQALSDAVTRGLRLSLADGSMQKLFTRTYGELIRNLQLDKRRVLELNNSALPDDVARSSPELWFEPGEQP